MSAFFLLGAFVYLHKAIDLLVVAGIISNSKLFPFYIMVARCVVYAVISAGLGHAIVNLMVSTHWLFIYLFATHQRIDAMLNLQR